MYAVTAPPPTAIPNNFMYGIDDTKNGMIVTRLYKKLSTYDPILQYIGLVQSKG